MSARTARKDQFRRISLRGFLRKRISSKKNYQKQYVKKLARYLLLNKQRIKAVISTAEVTKRGKINENQISDSIIALDVHVGTGMGVVRR
jgi:hypothetical protein